ncbi:MAG: extracellular solute-binding protein [Anaerovibrio sp.]
MTRKLNGNVCVYIAASVIFLLSLLLTGCGSEDVPKAANGKEKVTIALWGNDLLENYAPYLCKKFPDVEFEFVLATNSIDYYRYLNEHEDLPDIMTVRRFSMRDAMAMKDVLYDLSNTDLADIYYGTYLDNYTYSDGTVNWLPVCAEVDDIIVNKTLFEENGIPLPTDYASFVAACQAFEAKGIIGFQPDYGQDYCCMEVLQGFGVEHLYSMAGREWRQKYESGQTDQLDEKVWLPVFERFFDLKEKTGIPPEATGDMNFVQKARFTEGKMAMYRGTGNDLITFPGRAGKNDEVILMPYFGTTNKDDWYLTYPAFQVAVAKKGMEKPERRKLILEIMEAMLSQEGQNNISHGKNMVSYTKDVKLELLPELDNLRPYIEENKMYIRLASSDMFRVSKSVVQDIIKGQLKTPQEAYDAFNARMNMSPEDEPVVVHIDKGYSHEFTSEHGNQAASAIYNTIRKKLGVDMVFVQSCYVSGDIYAGDYTARELSYLTHTDAAWPMLVRMTGAQVYEMIEKSFALKNGYGVVSNDSTMYTASGFEMDISRTDDGGYRLNKLTRNGSDLDREAVYTLILMGDRNWTNQLVISKMGITDYSYDVDKCDVQLYDHLVKEGKKLEEPTDYITIH